MIPILVYFFLNQINLIRAIGLYTYQYMIQFEFPQTTDIQKTVSSYLTSDSLQDKKLCVNSILIYLSQNKKTLSDIMNILDAHLKLPKSTNQALLLLHEIIKKKKDLQLDQTNQNQVLNFLCEKVLNLSTTLTTLKIILELVKRSFSQISFQIVFSLLSNPKFHPPSHRQEVRLVAYEILQIMTQHPQYFMNPTLKAKYVSAVIDSTYEQRDPRNIGKMFTLYYWILNNIQNNLVLPYKQSMFTNLQAYYPIDYIGEQDEQTSVTLEDLNRDLDNCLTLPIFNQQCLQLLESKTATPPILQFLPTIKKFMEVNPSSSSKLETILQRFVQEQFLQDPLSYPMIIQCIQLLFKNIVHNPPLIEFVSYEYLIKILDSTLGILGSKSGFAIQLIKALSSRKQTQSITGTYIIQHLIINYKLYNTDNLGYLLGLIIVLSSIPQDQHLMQLLNISLMDIFVTQPVHIQILVLKIIMNISKKQTTTQKIRNIGPIIKNLLQLLKNPNEQTILRKSVIEFVWQSGDEILLFQTKQFMQQIQNNIWNQSYSNLEILIYYLMINQPTKIATLLVKETEIADSILDEIEANIFKMKPDQIVNMLTTLNYQIIADKYIQKFKDISNKTTKDEYLQQLFQLHFQKRQSIHPALTKVFSPVLKSLNLISLDQGSQLNSSELRIRNLNTVQLNLLQSSLTFQNLKSICNKSSDDFPTFRQYIFQKIYPLVQKLSMDLNYQYILFLILQETPSSLLNNSISSILDLVMSKLENPNPEIASVCLGILNIYFGNIDQSKYGKIVSVIVKILTDNDSHGMLTLCNSAQILGKIVSTGGQIKYRKIALEGLQKIIGHKKRKVRRVAAYSYNKWYYI